MLEFKEKGKTIFFVSHSMSQVANFTDKLLWVQYGELRQFGPTTEVIESYKEWITWFKAKDATEQKQYQLEQKQLQTHFSTDDLWHRIQADTALSTDEKAMAKARPLFGQRLTWLTWLMIIGLIAFMVTTLTQIVVG
jgi:teichoic acid transport system ATP-binding protein